MCGIVCVAALFASCSVTRYVPQDKYLLNRNIIKTDRETPAGERISDEDINRYVRQTPARKLLRTNIPVAIYSLSDTARHNFFSRIFRTLGSAPVVLDSAQIVRSARNIPGTKIMNVASINVYDLLNYKTLVVTPEVVARLEEVYAK